MTTNFPINPWLAATTTCLLLAVSGTALAQTCPPGNLRVAPDTRYEVTEPASGQFVVTDTQTGLMWKQCREGQSGATCAGTASMMTWSAALAAANASTHAGFGDWRLPNTIELQSLVESGCYNPAINTTSFPNPVSATDYVWSSSSYAPNASGAWNVSFYYGHLNAYGKSYSYAVRLVRGGQWLDPFSSEGDATPDAFDPVDQNDVPLSDVRTSAPITVSGLGLTTVTGIGVSGAAGSSYSINSEDDADFTSAPGVVEDGDMVRVRHTSAATAGVATTTTLIIGGVTGDFTTTTGKADQAITFGINPGPVTYGNTASVAAAADSGLSVVYGVAAGSETVCAVDASTGAITTLTVGGCTLTADQPGDASYNPAPQQTQTVQIVARTLTITPTAGQSKVYGSTDPSSFAYTHSGLVAGDALTGGLARAPGENVATYAYAIGTLAVAANPGNYSLTLAPETFAITTLGIDVTADPVHKTYGESDPELSYSVTPSLLPGDSFSGNLARASGEDAGVYAITQGTLTAGGNYAITFDGADFTIHQAAQAPLAISLSPDSLQVGETGTLSASGGSGTGAVSFEVTDGAAVCQVVGDTLTAIGVGTCTVTVTKAGDVNHQVASATLAVAVAAAAAPTLIPASGWLALLAMCLLMLAGAWLGVQRVQG